MNAVPKKLLPFCRFSNFIILARISSAKNDSFLTQNLLQEICCLSVCDFGLPASGNLGVALRRLVSFTMASPARTPACRHLVIWAWPAGIW